MVCWSACALIFSLMIGPPAAARALTARPPLALALSVAIALAVAWAAIALSYQTNWPIGFFVGILAAACYACGRGWRVWRTRRAGLPRRLQPAPPRATGRPPPDPSRVKDRNPVSRSDLYTDLCNTDWR